MAFRRSQKASDPEVLFDPAGVDLVAVDSGGSVVELVIVADAAWTGSDAQIRSLQEKIHAYVGFAVDGQLVATYPEVESMPWRIVITGSAGQPDLRTASVIERTRTPVQGHGGDLITRV